MRWIFVMLAAGFSADLLGSDRIDDNGPNSFSESLGRQATLEFSFEPETDLAAGGGFSFWDSRVSAPVFGKRLSDDWLIAARLRYRFSEIDWTEQALFDNSSLHRIDFGLNLIYKPADSPWVGFLSAGPSLATDGSEIDGDDLFYVALIGVGYRFNEKFSLLGGAYFSQDFGEPRLIPAPGFIWTPNSQWAISLIPPRLRIAYAPNKDWRLAVEAFPDGGRWSVSTLDGGEAFLDRSGARAGFRLERRCFDKAWLFLGVGAVFSRDLTLETSGGQALFESDADTGLYVAGGFVWTF